MIKEISVEKVFLFISLIFGLIYVFILPPFQSVDEASHFYRGYEIISNKPVPQKVGSVSGDYLPSSLEKLVSKYNFLIKNIDAKISAKDILNSADIKLNEKETKFIPFPNTALYSPICYLTQLSGMYISKSLNLNPLIIFYMGRLSNLLFFTLIIYFSIKIIPFYKLTLMLLALMPMTLSLAGALTSDVVVIGINFLWVSLLLRFLFEKEKINNFQICSLVFIAMLLCLSKYYFMLIPLIFLLPKSIFKNDKKYFYCTLGTILVSIAGVLLWHRITGSIYVNLNGEANSAGQINFITHHPFSYLAVILKTLIIKTPRVIITMIGVLGWQDTRLDFLTYILYPILIVLSILSEDKTTFTLERWQIYLISADLIVSVFLIFTTMYVMWSKVGSDIIYGLNGKYFLPLVLPFLLLFYNRTKNTLNDNMKILICIAIVLILISSDLSLLHRFYGLTPCLYYKI